MKASRYPRVLLALLLTSGLTGAADAQVFGQDMLVVPELDAHGIPNFGDFLRPAGNGTGSGSAGPCGTPLGAIHEAHRLQAGLPSPGGATQALSGTQALFADVGSASSNPSGTPGTPAGWWRAAVAPRAQAGGATGFAGVPKRLAGMLSLVALGPVRMTRVVYERADWTFLREYLEVIVKAARVPACIAELRSICPESAQTLEENTRHLDQILRDAPTRPNPRGNGTRGVSPRS